MVTRILEISVQNMLHNWHYLLAGAVLAAMIQTFLPAGGMSRWFSRAPSTAVLLATAVGALTPLCSCGSVAVMLSLVAADVPWSPIAAFLVSSPLMSPEMYVLTAGQLGIAFANARLISAVLMGLVAGYAVLWVEGRNKQDVPQQATATPACGCGTPEVPAPACGCTPETPEPACACGTPARPPSPLDSLSRLIKETLRQSVFILRYFVVFVVIGSTLQVLAPQSLVQALVGAGRAYAVPLAALVGTPLYVSGVGAIAWYRCHCRLSPDLMATCRLPRWLCRDQHLSPWWSVETSKYREGGPRRQTAPAGRPSRRSHRGLPHLT